MRILAALVCLAVVGELILMGLVYRTTRLAYDPVPADAIIVLGARVYPDGNLSLTLSRRTQKGYQAWKEGLAPLLIVCGGQGADEPVSEAQAMAGLPDGTGGASRTSSWRILPPAPWKT